MTSVVDSIAGLSATTAITAGAISIAAVAAGRYLFSAKRVPEIPVIASPSADGQFDFVVIGAGLIGLATARELLKQYPQASICIVEQDDRVAQRQSKWNAGILHSGIYDYDHTCKGRLAARGARALKDFCTAKGVHFETIGEYIVANDEFQTEQLYALQRQASFCGVKTELVPGSKVREVEPNVNVEMALWNPEMAVVDFEAVAKAMEAELLANSNVKIITGFKVNAAAGATTVSSTSTPGTEQESLVQHESVRVRSTKGDVVEGKHVIAAAGGWSDDVGVLLGGPERPSQVLVRVRYWQLKKSRRDLIKKASVFPAPEVPGLHTAIHWTPMVAGIFPEGAVTVGPSNGIGFSHEPTGFDFKVFWKTITNTAFLGFTWANLTMVRQRSKQHKSKAAFVAEARKVIPSLTEDDLEDPVVCVAPTATGLTDYAFEFTTAPGGASTRVLNVRSAPSPAASSCLTLAEHIVRLMRKELEGLHPLPLEEE